ncbi:putative nucleoporin [Helianthus annuus]|nr:putative nucleoporin [Helianthus annuus]
MASVDASLWWDPFTDLLTDLENLSPSSELPISLANKLKENHLWLLNSVSLFKPPSQKSKEALDSQQVQIGSHRLTVQTKFKELALKISSSLCLDEVQSYILVERSCEHDTSDIVALEPLHLVMIQYYIERQCVLKCTRHLLMLSLYVEDGSKADSSVREMVLKLISDGLESRLLSVIESLLSATYPESMEVDFFTLWAEEMLIEDNLILDILFIAYYESFCTCDGKQWKNLCLLYERMISGSCNFGKLAISTEAVKSVYHARVQLLLILIETLYLENILQMVHDETPFSQGNISFALSDIQEVDAIISSLDPFETKEAGPLILAWAVFLCLISSLPEKPEYNMITETDHVGYVRQAIRAASLNYFDEILQSDLLKDSEGPIASSRSVLRTFFSAFIASYEISLQLEDNNLKLILNILGEIYRGEESLCVQFWDRDSFIDGPIRCLLYNLEGEFPFRTVELISLLSALSEGAWPAECVYNFLDKSVGLSTLVELRGNFGVDNNSRIIETRLPLCVPGFEGLEIPRDTRGRVLKFIDDNTALVRWEYNQSGVLVLLLRVAQEMYPDGSEEVLVILDLISRLVTFNKAVCHSLLSIGDTIHDRDIRLNVAEIICTLIKNLSPTVSGALMMSSGVNILAMMLNCSPSHVTPTILKTNIFDVSIRMNSFNDGPDGLSSGSWLLSGRLAKLLVVDCEHNDSSCPLAVSVLELTFQLLQKGIENDFLLALTVFSIQYVLINHEYWKYKVRHSRWKVTLKVLDVLKTCIVSISHSPKMGEIIRDLLLSDSSVHNALFRIVCITTPTLENLYVSRLYDLAEIEGLQLAICSVLDIFCMLSDLFKDTLPGYQVFHQAVLSPTTKPIPVITAIVSLISFFRNPIQLGAVSALSTLLLTAEDLQPYMSGNACFGLDDKQIADFRNSSITIISDRSFSHEDLIVNTFKMLASAAYYQPALLVALIDLKDSTTDDKFDSVGPNREDLLDALCLYVEKSGEMIKSHPKILLNFLDLLMALWQGAPQFINILARLKKSGVFLKQLSSCISPEDHHLLSSDSLIASYRYQCQSDILQIMSLEMFLQNKLLHAENIRKDIVGKASNGEKTENGSRDILSSWCKNSVLNNLVKSYASCEYDNDKYLKGQISAALFSVQVFSKLRNGHTGSLSVSLVEKISILGKKLLDLPAFSELVTQYGQQGYSEGKEPKSLILSDLYYHIQGEYEGRKLEHQLFKALFQFLLESKLLESYKTKDGSNLSIHAKDVLLFDCARLEKDLGIELWDVLEFKDVKAVAQTMLTHMKEVNSMLLLSNCKLSALKALTTMLPLYDEDVTIGGRLSEQLIGSCIQLICRSVDKATESSVLDFLAAQVELLHNFIRFVKKISSALTLSSSTALVVVKDTSAGNIDVPHQTMFSDMAAIEVYKIAFHLLSFLCLQAAAAAKRAEDLGFVDVAHFPDLPMPDILHGLQDQGIGVVRELCEANRMTSEIKGVCVLLLQIIEKSLYLEFCVSQVCGIRPVMGRIEDFSKEIKLLFAATTGHAFLEETVKSLKQITLYVYPGLLQTEGCL